MIRNIAQTYEDGLRRSQAVACGSQCGSSPARATSSTCSSLTCVRRARQKTFYVITYGKLYERINGLSFVTPNGFTFSSVRYGSRSYKRDDERMFLLRKKRLRYERRTMIG